MTRVTDLLDKGSYEALYDLLREERKAADDTKDEAARRGSAVHRALEDYGRTGELPSPLNQPLEWQGYFRALASFIEDYDPTIHASEVRVGSAKDRLAGTYDVRATIAERTGLIDAKTSKAPYPENFFQLGFYDRLARECGEDPAEFLAVLRLAEDGTYEYVELPADSHLVSPERLDAALLWFWSLKEMKTWLDKERGE